MKTTFRNLAFLAVGALIAFAGIAAGVPDHVSAVTGFAIDPSNMLALSLLGTVFTEGRYAGEHIVSEAEGTRSRDVITLVTGQNLGAGTVLGKIRGAVTSAALGSNTGNGVMGAITAGAGAMEGAYKLTIIEAAANAGAFVVENPLGAIVGHGNVAAAFNAGGLAFTLADGATDFLAGDSFTLTVAAGTKYAAFNAGATDGTEAAAAVLFDAVDATAADKPAVVHLRDCEIASAKLTWFAGTTDPQKAAALVQLAALGVIAR